ncbi:hypothetical protein ACFQHO_39675 [Actinomadura yumaensis]|uniref:hypothetical protein n=1 Tax=Actinomadura TaxID=1988 RepID=UPI00132C6F9E|nr:hypothetical protein [Actinomadura sp. J1-007]MWK38792.1 hypothetical protein [Actinomadura sp. J1-007]
MPPASGTFEVEHWLDASHENGVTFSGKVDCLMVGGRTAASTGVIDKARLHGNVPPDGCRRRSTRTDGAEPRRPRPPSPPLRGAAVTARDGGGHVASR